MSNQPKQAQNTVPKPTKNPKAALADKTKAMTTGSVVNK